jgi:hypothetical protein
MRAVTIPETGSKRKLLDAEVQLISGPNFD